MASLTGGIDLADEEFRAALESCDAGSFVEIQAHKNEFKEAIAVNLASIGNFRQSAAP